MLKQIEGSRAVAEAVAMSRGICVTECPSGAIEMIPEET